MTKESIANILAHNRRPIAVHAIWAKFEALRRDNKSGTVTASLARETLWEALTHLKAQDTAEAIKAVTKAISILSVL